MREIEKRLRKIEAGLPSERQPARRFVASGPIGFDAVGFLRACGHDIGPGDFVRVIIDAEDGAPVGCPLADLTSLYGREEMR